MVLRSSCRVLRSDRTGGAGELSGGFELQRQIVGEFRRGRAIDSRRAAAAADAPPLASENGR